MIIYKSSTFLINQSLTTNKILIFCRSLCTLLKIKNREKHLLYPCKPVQLMIIPGQLNRYILKLVLSIVIFAF